MLGGCASTPEQGGYPGAWPPLARMTTAEDCPSLAGTFNDSPFAMSAAETDFSKSSPVNLTALFARMAKSALPPSRVSPSERALKAWRVPSEARTVAIEQSSASLMIKFMDGPDPDSQITFRRSLAPLLETRLDDVFICDSSDGIPRLHFMLDVDAIAGGAAFIGAGLSRKNLTLYRATDASLVAEWTERTAGLILVVPFFQERSVWRLYHPTATTAP